MPLNLHKLKKKLEDLHNKNNTRDSLVTQYATYGFLVKPNDIFYKIRIGNEYVWGLKIGQITHSCHIDTTEMVVLFFVDRDPQTRLMSDNWLIDSITV